MSELTIKLNDGLDLRLSIAGPGARAYAFLLDFKFRVLAALLWLGVGMTIFHLLGRDEFANIFEEEQKPFLLTVGIPIMVIYFLYHPIFELLLGGRTPGKIIAGIRIVDLSGRAGRWHGAGTRWPQGKGAQHYFGASTKYGFDAGTMGFCA
jgi:uncharacterized RDD family membrane protein YckC